MADAGRIKFHLKNNLWRAESTILFVGYQAVGTLGRRILDGEKLVTIHGDQVAVKSDIKSIEAYSAHADQIGLMSWLKNFKMKPHTVFLVHGEEKVIPVLGNLIQKELNLPVVIPNWLDEMELKPIAIAEAEKMLQVVPDYRTQMINKAMEAEAIYLKLRNKLNNMFQDRFAKAQYEELIEQLRKIDSEI